MDLAHRVIGVYLALVGLAEAGYLVVYPLYGGGGDVAGANDVWGMLNWFVAVAAVLLLMVTAHVKQALPDDADTWTRFVVNLRFYGTIVVALAFFSNWFAREWGGEVAPTGLLWIVVNIGLPLIAINVAVQLLRGPEQA